MIHFGRHRPLALALMNFRALYRLSNPGLAAWLDVPVEELPSVGAYPCPDRDSPTLAADCAAIARVTGADPWALRHVVVRSDWADILWGPPARRQSAAQEAA